MCESGGVALSALTDDAGGAAEADVAAADLRDLLLMLQRAVTLESTSRTQAQRWVRLGCDGVATRAAASSEKKSAPTFDWRDDLRRRLEQKSRSHTLYTES